MLCGTNRGAVTEHKKYTLIAPGDGCFDGEQRLTSLYAQSPYHTTLHHLFAGLQARHDACINTRTRSPSSRRGVKQLAYSAVAVRRSSRLAHYTANGIVGHVPGNCLHICAIICQLPQGSVLLERNEFVLSLIGGHARLRNLLSARVLNIL
jgi:hypothetical protein